MAVSLTLSPEQVDLLQGLIPRLGTGQRSTQDFATPKRTPPLRHRSITSRESTAARTPSSSNSSYRSEYYSDMDTDNTDNLSESQYSADDMFFKKKKNTKGTEAQKYLLVSS